MGGSEEERDGYTMRDRYQMIPRWEEEVGGKRRRKKLGSHSFVATQAPVWSAPSRAVSF